ncbi:hypothetical protein AAG906_013531 [Vitis piasezkii]
MIHYGYTEHLIRPFLECLLIAYLVGNQEAQHGFEQSGMKMFLNLNEMEEPRNDAYNNSNIAKQRLKRWHDQLVSRKEFQKGQRVDRSFYYSTSAFKWSSGTTQFQQHREFQSQWPSSQAICGAFFSRQGGNHPP